MGACVHCATENADDAVICARCGEKPTLAPGWAPEEEKTGAIPAALQSALSQRVAARFDIISVLGKGGMGTVYRVRDRELGEDVALKMLQGSPDAAEVERLKREVVTARRITHPNVVRLHDFGVAEGEGYFSMELLPGGTLADRIKKGALPFDEAMRIAIGIARGLGAAHRAGIVHRDLKPMNVLFDVEDTPKLVDFGLARVADATQRTVGFSGTPHYMSPEMADGNEITVRSDVYSLGVLLFEVFTGRVPFQGDTLIRLALLHTQEAPPKPRSLRHDLPPALEHLLLRCLEKDPARRPADAAEVAAALERIARGEYDVPREIPWKRIAVVAFATASIGAIALGVWYESGRTPATPVADASATPASTQLAMASGAPGPVLTPAATGPTPAETAVAAASPHATPRATARPTGTRVAIARTPAGDGKLTVFARPWARVIMDGKELAGSTPVQAAAVSAGDHVVRVENDVVGFRAERKISVKAGHLTTISVDVRAGTVEVR